MFPLRVLTTIFRTGSDIRSDYRFHSTREKVNALLHDLEKNSSISFDNCSYRIGISNEYNTERHTAICKM